MATNVVTGEKTRGRAAKYTLAAVHSTPATLDGVSKATGNTETVDTVEYTVSNIAEALEVVGNDDEALWSFVSEALTDYAQRSARSALSAKIQGPAKTIIRMAKDFVKSMDMSAAEAIDMVLNIGVQKGTFSQAYVDSKRASLIAALPVDEDGE